MDKLWKIYGSGWWLSHLPLWNMMEFLNWDDDIPNWMENKKCYKPPPRYNQILFSATIIWTWYYLGYSDFLQISQVLLLMKHYQMNMKQNAWFHHQQFLPLRFGDFRNQGKFHHMVCVWLCPYRVRFSLKTGGNGNICFPWGRDPGFVSIDGEFCIVSIYTWKVTGLGCNMSCFPSWHATNSAPKSSEGISVYEWWKHMRSFESVCRNSLTAHDSVLVCNILLNHVYTQNLSNHVVWKPSVSPFPPQL